MPYDVPRPNPRVLWDRYYASRSDEDRDALVTFFDFLISWNVSRAIDRDPTRDQEHLTNLATLALQLAVQSYEQGCEIGFTTMASIEIRRMIGTIGEA